MHFPVAYPHDAASLGTLGTLDALTHSPYAHTIADLPTYLPNHAEATPAPSLPPLIGDAVPSLPEADLTVYSAMSESAAAAAASLISAEKTSLAAAMLDQASALERQRADRVHTAGILRAQATAAAAEADAFRAHLDEGGLRVDSAMCAVNDAQDRLAHIQLELRDAEQQRARIATEATAASAVSREAANMERAAALLERDTAAASQMLGVGASYSGLGLNLGTVGVGHTPYVGVIPSPPRLPPKDLIGAEALPTPPSSNLAPEERLGLAALQQRVHEARGGVGVGVGVGGGVVGRGGGVGGGGGGATADPPIGGFQSPATLAQSLSPLGRVALGAK